MPLKGVRSERASSKREQQEMRDYLRHWYP